MPSVNPAPIHSVTILRVTDFGTLKDAKDFLANRIAAQARSENVSLSEVERKMLYWSETDWTLPDMKAVGTEFDRDYDQKEYEQKIARLTANIIADHHHRNEDEEEKWDAAVWKLAEGDNYLSVLINAGRAH
jgi:isoleucyl-tRNA synthetase